MANNEEVYIDQYDRLETRRVALTEAISYGAMWASPPSPLEVTTIAAQFEAWLTRGEKHGDD